MGRHIAKGHHPVYWYLRSIKSSEAALGIVCGTGVAKHIEGLRVVRVYRRALLLTPFGRPSSDIIDGYIGATRVLVLFRHGPNHTLSPAEVPYAANAWALKALGAIRVAAFTAVGSLTEEFAPTNFLVPSSIVDRALDRRRSFFAGSGRVVHTSAAELVCPDLRQFVSAAAEHTGIKCHDGGTLVTISGPQFGSLAESEEFRGLGWSAVGMTTATEAKFVREAELCYVAISMCTDYDCWRGEHVSVATVVANMAKNSTQAGNLLLALSQVAGLLQRPCDCLNTLDAAVQSDLAHAPRWNAWRYRRLLERYQAAQSGW